MTSVFYLVLVVLLNLALTIASTMRNGVAILATRSGWFFLFGFLWVLAFLLAWFFTGGPNPRVGG